MQNPTFSTEGFLFSDHYISATDFYPSVSSSGGMPHIDEECLFSIPKVKHNKRLERSQETCIPSQLPSNISLGGETIQKFYFFSQF